MKKAIFVSAVIVLLASTFICKSKESTMSNKPSWDYIKTSFLTKDYTASTFKKDIKIQLSGNYSIGDSIFVSAIVTELKGIIKSVDVYMVSNEGNLKLTIDGDSTRTSVFDDGIRRGGVFSLSDTDGAVGKVGIKLNFDSIISQEKRNKAIQYKLVQSLIPLCSFYHKTVAEVKEINPNGIFSQSDYKQVSFNQFDKAVITMLYLDDFYKQFFKRFPFEFINYVRKITFIKKSSRYFNSNMSLILLLLYGVIILRFWNFNGRTKMWLKNGINGMILTFPLFILQFGEILLLHNKQGLIFPAFLILTLLFFILFIGLLSGSFSYLLEKLILPNNKHKLFVYISQFAFTFLGGLLAIYCLNQFYKNTYGYREVLAIYAFAIAAVRTGLNFLKDKSYLEIREKELQLAKMEELKSKAELQAIQSRINPHFLYNSLNSIASLAINNPEITRKMALSLSEFCRFTLNKTNSDNVLVKDEVKMVSSYLEIEKVRFGEKLNFSFRVDENINNLGIPRFIILPLIENTIKHSASKMTNTCEIQLQIESESGGISITVSDNGPSFPELPVYGYGLQSIFDKLEILYAGNAKINWENTPYKKICIWLPIIPNKYD